MKYLQFIVIFLLLGVSAPVFANGSSDKYFFVRVWETAISHTPYGGYTIEALARANAQIHAKRNDLGIDAELFCVFAPTESGYVFIVHSSRPLSEAEASKIWDLAKSTVGSPVRDTPKKSPKN